MTNLWNFIVPILVIALIFVVTTKAVIGQYFKAKRGFVEDMLGKVKGANDGKGT